MIEVFNPPIHRGTSIGLKGFMKITVSSPGVSIPYSSGHFDPNDNSAANGKRAMGFQSPIHRGTSIN